MDSFDAVVVGAGVLGGATAYYLAKEGLKVCLMDREAVGSGASAHGHGAMSMVGKDFRPGPHFTLGLVGMEMYAGFVESVMEDSGIDPMYHESDGVSLAVDDEEEQIFKEAIAGQSQYLEMKWIDGDEVRRMEPRITPDALGAVLYRHGQVDAYRLSLATAQAVERMGGQLLLREATGLKTEGDRVTGVTYPGGEVSAGAVVIAMGAWSAAAREWLHFPLPVRPLHGQVLHVRMPGEPVRLFIITARHGPILPRRDGILMAGSLGGVSMSGLDVDSVHVFDPRDTGPWEFDLNPSEWGRNFMLERVLKIMPALDEAEVVDHLAGVRPLCADRMPLIGPVPGWQGAYIATGHGTKGIHLSAVTGRIVADQIVCGNTEVPVPAEAFSPGRFAYLAG
ncbi:MAG: FAD-dependent oxidoreductase [Dehalococcoidia bacterium]|jgi:glycine oxidase|nr:FAD-dependent oxidoreductase [Dehalococcoidia bacterium]